ncbi:DUF6807 domain-containing protein [Actinoalloteichus hymeniacidonis]|uniref:Methane oxygenase PmoA n=1 Tax=Actinoalloteichus hymeniacidonis TaxID=340345 RepID=A0AAC9MYL0_9PSEU|nr:PmoA family protein [Actinoalloteichus hymeniacidonis]AOS64468.1 Methane oxygenase PmoA [Actinoalloteichus hymeniacidonis]MBB5907462.1 hypothetical protein [Actinoalloteichus hymeniacidonis]
MGILHVRHELGTEIVVDAAGVEILSYVYRPDPIAFESPKPYCHPLRTLAGDVVTDYRPNDHRWHKGLQLTASHVSGDNFWGGVSYVRDEGYVVKDNIGRMRHDGFDLVDARCDRLDIVERLTWISSGDEVWAEEVRRIAVHDVDLDDDSWTLTWHSAITNVRGEELRFGSPTTEGREMAGYTGLAWRGPRAFRDGTVRTPHGHDASSLMGQPADWVAYIGEHDEVDRHSTVVFQEGPRNAVRPAHWFVRNDPFAVVNPSWAFHEELILAPGEVLDREYRMVVGIGDWPQERITSTLADRSWD